MKKGKKLYEGKAKIIYASNDKNLVIQHFKDDATAFNNQKKDVIEGKGILNNRISEHILTQLSNVGIKNHERIGGAFLRHLDIPYPIPELVEGHVKAKRYLAREKKYYKLLSEASKKSLKMQGGVMNSEEAAKFENNEFFEDSIKLRKFDELAKRPEIKIKSIIEYKNLLTSKLL